MSGCKMKLDNKSIVLRDGAEIKIGEAMLYMPTRSVVTLKACNRQNKQIMVEDSDIVYNSGLFVSLERF